MRDVSRLAASERPRQVRWRDLHPDRGQAALRQAFTIVELIAQALSFARAVDASPTPRRPPKKTSRGPRPRHTMSRHSSDESPSRSMSAPRERSTHRTSCHSRRRAVMNGTDRPLPIHGCSCARRGRCCCPCWRCGGSGRRSNGGARVGTLLFSQFKICWPTQPRTWRNWSGACSPIFCLLISMGLVDGGACAAAEDHG